VHEIGEVGNQIYMSMAYTLGNKCAKNLCKQIVLLQLIIENVVTCFFWNTVYKQCVIRLGSLLPLLSLLPMLAKNI